MSHEYNIEAVNNGFLFKDYDGEKYNSVRSVYTTWDQVVERITKNPLEFQVEAD